MERNRDLAFAGGFVVLTPVHHVFRGIVLDATSMKGIYRLSWSAQDMFGPHEVAGLEGWIRMPAVSSRAEFFGLPETDQSRLLCNAVEQDTLPFLRVLESIEAYYKFAVGKSRPVTWWPLTHFRHELAIGNFQSAERIAEQHLDPLLVPDPSWSESTRIFRQEIGGLWHCLQIGDYRRIAKVLRHWEARTAGNLKVGHLWRPTSFPFEASI